VGSHRGLRGLRPRHRPLGGIAASARGRSPPRSGSHQRSDLHHRRLHRSAVQRDHRWRLGLRPSGAKMYPDCGSAGTAGTARHGRNGGRSYVPGGVGPEYEDLWIYDPATERWGAARAALPMQGEHLAVMVLDGKLYAVGGPWVTRAILRPSRSMIQPQARGPTDRICRPRGADLRPACLTATGTSRAASHSRLVAPSVSMRPMTRRPPYGPRSPVCPRRAMAGRRGW
jgi:hypothetical protein